MKLTKKLKSDNGFTLVELVVVIAVLAILAGVGSVAYSGYIKKAKDAADLSLLSAIKTAADATAAAHVDSTTPDNSHFSVAKIIVSADKGQISKIELFKDASGTTGNATQTIEYNSGWNDDDFATFYGNNATAFESDTYAKGATCTSDGWKAN